MGYIHLFLLHAEAILTIKYRLYVKKKKVKTWIYFNNVTVPGKINVQLEQYIKIFTKEKSLDFQLETETS